MIVKSTNKGTVVYDAQKLLTDVKKMVNEEKAKNKWKLTQPGMKSF